MSFTPPEKFEEMLIITRERNYLSRLRNCVLQNDFILQSSAVQSSFVFAVNGFAGGM
jgi:hypothetical protein